PSLYNLSLHDALPIFASAVGGASEMTGLAERYGARPDLVASAHGLRVLMVVVIIPFAFEALGFSGEQAGAVVRPDFLNLPGLALDRKSTRLNSSHVKI